MFPQKLIKFRISLYFLDGNGKRGGFLFYGKPFSEKYTLLLIALLESPKDFKREALCKGSKTRVALPQRYLFHKGTFTDIEREP